MNEIRRNSSDMPLVIKCINSFLIYIAFRRKSAWHLQGISAASIDAEWNYLFPRRGDFYRPVRCMVGSNGAIVTFWLFSFAKPSILSWRNESSWCRIERTFSDHYDGDRRYFRRCCQNEKSMMCSNDENHVEKMIFRQWSRFIIKQWNSSLENWRHSSWRRYQPLFDAEGVMLRWFIAIRLLWYRATPHISRYGFASNEVAILHCWNIS